MVNPQKVLGFLDVAGSWDPSLMFVLGSGLLVTIVAFLPITRMAKPVLDVDFRLPTPTAIDIKLIGGAALFGIGWGLVGYCPGPAIASLAYGQI
ncbi:MAG TPA: YeeE/YedE family protein, partial [Rhodospirillales bacterium]|nr:YeeE/YedE family protein [Rhodospirillales bacterium]